MHPRIFNIRQWRIFRSFAQNALESKPKLITKAPPEICDFRLPWNCQSTCFLNVSLFNTMSLGCHLGYAYIANIYGTVFCLQWSLCIYSLFFLFLYTFQC